MLGDPAALDRTQTPRGRCQLRLDRVVRRARGGVRGCGGKGVGVRSGRQCDARAAERDEVGRCSRLDGRRGRDDDPDHVSPAHANGRAGRPLKRREPQQPLPGDRRRARVPRGRGGGSGVPLDPRGRERQGQPLPLAAAAPAASGRAPRRRAGPPRAGAASQRRPALPGGILIGIAPAPVMAGESGFREHRQLVPGQERGDVPAALERRLERPELLLSLLHEPALERVREGRDSGARPRSARPHPPLRRDRRCAAPGRRARRAAPRARDGRRGSCPHRCRAASAGTATATGRRADRHRAREDRARGRSGPR